MEWHYEKLDEKGKLISVNTYTIDSKKKYTGRYVVNVKAWSDEHPEEWIARGWTKHITWSSDEIKEKWPFNAQTQLLIRAVKRVDEHTVEDDFHVIDKSEEMMRFAELQAVAGWGDTVSIDNDTGMIWM